MATPTEIRRERLKNDHEEMCRIRGPIIQWRALAGAPPYVEKYALTIKIRSVVDPKPVMREAHHFDVVLPAGYPMAPPEVVCTDQPIPFNPNIWPSGRWCHGRWLPTKLLGEHILRLARTLQFDPHLINLKSAANHDAAAWYAQNQGGRMYPTDTQALPSTQRPRMTIRPR